MTNPLTHFDDQGASRMVDVSEKSVTSRRAVAEGWVTMAPETLSTIVEGQISKGNVLEIGRLAGIMATKQTSLLIPLCHPLPIDGVRVEVLPCTESSRIRLVADVTTTARTGVEMEALTAVTVAALTIYDMAKAIDREMTLGPFQLLEKSGGRSGHYQRSTDDTSNTP